MCSAHADGRDFRGRHATHLNQVIADCFGTTGRQLVVVGLCTQTVCVACDLNPLHIHIFQLREQFVQGLLAIGLQAVLVKTEQGIGRQLHFHPRLRSRRWRGRDHRCRCSRCHHHHGRWRGRWLVNWLCHGRHVRGTDRLHDGRGASKSVHQAQCHQVHIGAMAHRVVHAVAFTFQAQSDFGRESVLRTQTVLVIGLTLMGRRIENRHKAISSETVFGFGIGRADAPEQGPAVRDGQCAHDVQVHPLDSGGAHQAVRFRSGGGKAQPTQIKITGFNRPIGVDRKTHQGLVSRCLVVLTQGVCGQGCTHETLRDEGVVDASFGLTATDAQVDPRVGRQLLGVQ